MADYTLHCFVESGNAYKPALMLQLAGADWGARWVNVFKGEHKSEEYLAQNVMGEVPMMIDHTQGDIAISQSGVILWHLADRFDQFAASNAEEHREVLRWILFDNHKLTGCVARYRVLHHFQKKAGSLEADYMKLQMEAALNTLNDHLGGREWVAADRVTIADISMCGYLFWPDHFGVTWEDYPNINAWLKRVTELPKYATPEQILPTSA